MESIELNEFAARYTAAWCSQTAASVASFFGAKGSLKINEGAPAVGRAAITEADVCGNSATTKLRRSSPGQLGIGGSSSWWQREVGRSGEPREEHACNRANCHLHREAGGSACAENAHRSQ